jgi:hypothetical protein
MDEGRVVLAKGDEGAVSVEVMVRAGWGLWGDDVRLKVGAEGDVLASERACEPPVDVSDIPSASVFCRDASSPVHELVAGQQHLDGSHCRCDHCDEVLQQAEDGLGCADDPHCLEAQDFVTLAVSVVKVCQTCTYVGIAFEWVLEKVPNAGGAVCAVAVGMAARAQEDGRVVGCDERVA